MRDHDDRGEGDRRHETGLRWDDAAHLTAAHLGDLERRGYLAAAAAFRRRLGLTRDAQGKATTNGARPGD